MISPIYIVPISDIFYSSERESDMTSSIHIQGIGKFTAKPANEFQVGDTMVWNHGSTSKVVEARREGKSVYIVMQTGDGKVWPERRFLGSRLIACTGLGGKVCRL